MSTSATGAMKRFYKQATATSLDGQFGVVLDDRPVKTPAKKSLIVPTQALAAAIAQEWDQQEEYIKPSRMPLTQLAITCQDRVAVAPEPVIEDMLPYIGTDLVSYRAGYPKELVARQMQHWEPMLAWFNNTLGVNLKTTEGITAIAQDPEIPENVRSYIAGRTPLQITALHSLVLACGSMVLGLAASHGVIDAQQTFHAANVDETFQMEQWGTDAELEKRRTQAMQDISAAIDFLRLIDGFWG